MHGLNARRAFLLYLLAIHNLASDLTVFPILGPKFFGDKVPVKMLNPVHQSTQKKIVMYHNFFRSRVHPPAADMLAMVKFKFFFY